MVVRWIVVSAKSRSANFWAKKRPEPKRNKRSWAKKRKERKKGLGWIFDWKLKTAYLETSYWYWIQKPGATLAQSGAIENVASLSLSLSLSRFLSLLLSFSQLPERIDLGNNFWRGYKASAKHLVCVGVAFVSSDQCMNLLVCVCTCVRTCVCIYVWMCACVCVCVYGWERESGEWERERARETVWGCASVSVYAKCVKVWGLERQFVCERVCVGGTQRNVKVFENSSTILSHSVPLRVESIATEKESHQTFFDGHRFLATKCWGWKKIRFNADFHQ